LYDHDINGPTFAEFLGALLRRFRGPVTLVWDGLAVHRAQAVKAVLARSPRVHVHRLPSYAPELNPVEQVWAHTKGHGLRGYVPENEIDLRLEAECVLDDLNSRRDLLRSFFKATPLAIPGVTT